MKIKHVCEFFLRLTLMKPWHNANFGLRCMCVEVIYEKRGIAMIQWYIFSELYLY
jgi:hypothetical protein